MNNSQLRHCLACTILCAVCSISPAVIGLTEVWPTGDPAQDVAAVRAAVEGGGTVLLKATDVTGAAVAFEFGDYPVSEINWDDHGAGYVALGTSGEIVPVVSGSSTWYVSLGNDVRLLGETDDGAMTTIHGGTIPIRNFEPKDVPGAGEQTVFGIARLEVEGIRFTESALQSMYTTQLVTVPEVVTLLADRGLHARIRIRGNEFIDVKPAYEFYWYSLAAVTDGPADTATIRDNLVQFTTGRWDADERAYEQQNGLDPAFELWEGISIANLRHPGDIIDNHVIGVDVGLLVYFYGSTFVRIIDNLVEVRPEAIVGISCQANHRYLIEGNTVIAPGSNPDGMYLWATDPQIGINDSVVRHNHVVLDGSYFGGISVFGAGTRNLFAENQVEGSGAYAVGLVDDFYNPGSPATNNRFVLNDISGFTPRFSVVYGAGAHVFFDTNTSHNLFIGPSRRVKDRGQDNMFIPPMHAH